MVSTLGTGEYADSERAAILGLVISHIPLMILEGVFTTFVVLFLQQAKPQLLENNG